MTPPIKRFVVSKTLFDRRNHRNKSQLFRLIDSKKRVVISFFHCFYKHVRSKILSVITLYVCFLKKKRSLTYEHSVSHIVDYVKTASWNSEILEISIVLFIDWLEPILLTFTIIFVKQLFTKINAMLFRREMLLVLLSLITLCSLRHSVPTNKTSQLHHFEINHPDGINAIFDLLPKVRKSRYS